MKHLKKFENFDLGHRFSDEEEGELKPLELEAGQEGHDEEEEEGFYSKDELEGEEECKPCEGEEEEEEEEEGEARSWGDEDELRLERVISFRQFEAKKAKPDFLDLDKDGDKKESMKKAAKDAKSDKKDDKKDDKDSKKEEKGGKGLTAAQKKLPEGLRKAIEAKKKK